MRTCNGHDHESGHVDCPAQREIDEERYPRMTKCSECRQQHDRYLNRARYKQHGRPGRPVRPSYKSGGSNNYCYRIKGEPMKAKEKKCDWCGSQPHACEPSRHMILGEGSTERYVQIAPDGKCKKCGLEYAPLPELERGSLLSSSMGTTARYGELHSYGGANMNEGSKRARRK